MSFIDNLSQQFMTDVTGGVTNRLFNAFDRSVNWRESQRYGERQNQWSKSMAAYNQHLAKDYYDYTSAAGQYSKMKESGLNPGLLYSNGSSSGGQTGGAKPMPAEENYKPMGMPQMQMTLRETPAERALKEAEARKLNADANVVETTGVGEAMYRMENLEAITGNEKLKSFLIQAETEWKNIQNNIASKSSEELINQVLLTNKNLAQELRYNMYKANVAEETQDEAIKQVFLTTLEQGVTIELIKQNILKSEQETEEIKTHITTMCTTVAQTWASLSLDERKVTVSELLAKFNTNTPSKIAQWTGIFGSLLSGAQKATSMDIGGTTIIKGFR